VSRKLSRVYCGQAQTREQMKKKSEKLYKSKQRVPVAWGRWRLDVTRRCHDYSGRCWRRWRHTSISVHRLLKTVYFAHTGTQHNNDVLLRCWLFRVIWLTILTNNRQFLHADQWECKQLQDYQWSFCLHDAVVMSNVNLFTQLSHVDYRMFCLLNDLSRNYWYWLV